MSVEHGPVHHCNPHTSQGHWASLRPKAFLRLQSLSIRRRAKPDALLAAVARLPNEMAWHVLSFWPAEADVAPPPPIITDEALLSELDGLVQAQANSR